MDALPAESIPTPVRDLLARWSHPSVWHRLRQVRVNLSNALAIEEAATLSAGKLLDTSEATIRAGRELDALAAEHAQLAKYITERHPALLADLPLIPPDAVLNAAEAVHRAERMNGVYGRVLERVGNPVDGWSDVLDVRDCTNVLKVPRNRASKVLNEMAGRGHARRENRQRWRLNLAALDPYQRARYAELIRQQAG